MVITAYNQVFTYHTVIISKKTVKKLSLVLLSLGCGLSIIRVLKTLVYLSPVPGGGRGGGNLHMKGMGMLVVSLRSVNFGFWSNLGCSG